MFLDKPLFSSSKPTAAAAPVTNIWEERKKQQLIQVSLVFTGQFYYNFFKVDHHIMFIWHKFFTSKSSY